MRLVVDVFDRCISRKHSLSMIEVLLGAIRTPGCATERTRAAGSSSYDWRRVCASNACSEVGALRIDVLQQQLHSIRWFFELRNKPCVQCFMRVDWRFDSKIREARDL